MLLAVVSDALPLTQVDDNADTMLAQQISQITASARSRSAASRSRRCASRSTRPSSCPGFSLEDVRTPFDHHRQPAERQRRRRDAQLHHLRQRPAHRRRAWNDVIVAYRNGAPVRVRDIGQAVPGPEDAKKAAWANGKRGVFLIISKQPGANVIDTVDAIKAELPRLQAAMPPAVNVNILSDRTQTIRASVHDVEFTLLLTIALVVGVIFVFLRSLWATVIPSVTVPLSLLGACALMYVAGYSLDNLSLMALTISVGFVVDDAIVMLENIVRHIEDGMPPSRGRAARARARSASPSCRSASR